MFKLILGIVVVISTQIRYPGGLEPNMTVEQGVCVTLAVLGFCMVVAGLDDLRKESRHV
jgi:hypothetical protein